MFLRVCEKVKQRLSNGQMKKDEFFQIAQFSYFPHKLAGQNTNFRLFKHYDPEVMAFILKYLPAMND